MEPLSSLIVVSIAAVLCYAIERFFKAYVKTQREEIIKEQEMNNVANEINKSRDISELTNKYSLIREFKEKYKGQAKSELYLLQELYKERTRELLGMTGYSLDAR